MNFQAQTMNTYPNFIHGSSYKISGFSNMNSDMEVNIHDYKSDDFNANTLMWELQGISVIYKDQLTHAGYTYYIFETNSLKDQDNREYNLNDVREVSFIKILNNNKDYSMFTFKPIFEDVEN